MIIINLKGWFRWPEGYKSADMDDVPVEVTLEQGLDGRMTGEMRETDTISPTYGQPEQDVLRSIISGRFEPYCRLQLTKTYQGIPGASPVYYDGKYNPNSKSIDGTWKVGLKDGDEFIQVVAQGPFHLEVMEPA